MTKNTTNNKMRFALMFDEKLKQFFIMINNGLIYESIFKHKKEGWTRGFALACQDSQKEKDGSTLITMGTPHIKYLSPFKEWIKAKGIIKIISKETNKEYSLTKKDIRNIKTQIKLADKRIKL